MNVIKTENTINRITVLRYVITFVIVSLIFVSTSFAQSNTTRSADGTIKIMPVGNSITAGEHYGYPSIPERTGYRKVLYEMLVEAGYNVDFVGSQNHGERPASDPDWYDWNNEAYPGWKISDIANKLDTALIVYQPDILLIHVGTNKSDWDNKPGQVMDMLDMINDFSEANDHPITVFLCKIIKRFYKEDSGPTSQFNEAVADSVAARSGDKIKIIMVDMENGAGLDYTDDPPDSTAYPPYEGGDMLGETYPGVTYDKYHPNDKGNTKMALKFYEGLVNELGEPTKVDNHVMNQQPQQFELCQNYPNPFNPTTTIEFNLKKSSNVLIIIYDLLGKELTTLVNEELQAGNYHLHWNASNFSSGIYLYKLYADGLTETKKMILIR